MQLKRVAVPVACAILALYFAYHAVVGDNGILAWRDQQREEVRLQKELAGARARRLALEHRVTLMRPESLDPDMLDERARENLNLAHPNDITIFRNAR
ncbi:MAG: septum formation initiator family protein [Hyphomicrobiales bacterium]|nr:septum formation initiator family protein [Hyphomicrobiales bacterium]